MRNNWADFAAALKTENKHKFYTWKRIRKIVNDELLNKGTKPQALLNLKN